MPFGRFDLIAILRHYAVNIRGRRSHESRNSRPHCYAHAFPEGPAIDGRLNVDASVVQIADPDHAELRRQTGIRSHAGIGGANIFGPPIVVHFVDFIDEDEARLGKVVGRGHDHIPHSARRQGLVDLAGHEAFLVRHIAFRVGPFAPHELRRIVEIRPLACCVRLEFLAQERERQLPIAVLLHGLHEVIADEQRQVELPQPSVLTLGANELEHVGMPDVERSHLRAAPAAGRGHGKTHLVVDIHERQRTGRVGAGSRHVRPARPQRRELVTDAASCFEGEARLVHLFQDIVHRIADGAGYGAVDRRCGGLVFERAGIRRDAAGGDRAMAQRPQERFVPLFAAFLGFNVGERARDAFIGIVHRIVDGRTVFRGQPIFLVPDVEGRFLERYIADVFGLYFDHRVHGY